MGDFVEKLKIPSAHRRVGGFTRHGTNQPKTFSKLQKEPDNLKFIMHPFNISKVKIELSISGATRVGKWKSYFIPDNHVGYVIFIYLFSVLRIDYVFVVRTQVKSIRVLETGMSEKFLLWEIIVKALRQKRIILYSKPHFSAAW